MSHFHNYELIHRTADGLLEVCSECKKKLLTRVDQKGRNSKEYLKEHIRDTAQPYGRTRKIFKQYYANRRKG